ncbi:MAG TPA: cytochrome P450 [Acidimicrobiales bacterium]|nr:cytochrome P450 [Acidimicrobiales bacterium]
MIPPTTEPGAARPVFDPFDPTWASDPFPLYADLRQRAPIHRNDLGFWVVARHADCLAVLRDRRASSDSLNVAVERMPEGFRTPIAEDDPVAAAMLEMRPFLFRDPPDHTRLRGLVSKAFTPKVVEALRIGTQLVVDELLDAAMEAGQVDLLEAFAYPLPVRVICDLLGVPVEDQDRFKVWSGALARGLDPDFLLTTEVIEARGEAVLQFSQYFFELLAERRQEPGEDLLSRLVQAEDGGTVLSEGELLSTCILLLVAGHETTVNLISGGTLALLRNPDQWERFRTDPEVHRSGVEEMLRFVSPVQLTGRALTEDCEFGGVRFAAGDFAMLLLASGNHDPDQFEDPERFDVTRTPNNHLGFGFGIHHCLGAPLARMETQVALASLARRAPDLALAADDVTYKSNIVLRGMESLPVSMRG